MINKYLVKKGVSVRCFSYCRQCSHPGAHPLFMIYLLFRKFELSSSVKFFKTMDLKKCSSRDLVSTSINLQLMNPKKLRLSDSFLVKNVDVMISTSSSLRLFFRKSYNTGISVNCYVITIRY